MNLTEKIIFLICLFVNVLGQILYKQVSINFNLSNNIFSLSVGGLALFTSSFYIIQTILYIKLLQTVPLSILYPYMSLAFIMVSILAILIFKESINTVQVLGIILISFGVSLLSYKK